MATEASGIADLGMSEEAGQRPTTPLTNPESWPGYAGSLNPARAGRSWLDQLILALQGVGRNRPDSREQNMPIGPMPQKGSTPSAYYDYARGVRTAALRSLGQGEEGK